MSLLVRCDRFGDQHVRTGVRQDVGHFSRLQKIIDGHDDTAGLQHAKNRADEFGAIFQPEADAVVRAHAEILVQAGSHPTGLRPQSFVRILGVTPKDSRFSCVLFRGYRKGRGQVHVRNRGRRW